MKAVLLLCLVAVGRASVVRVWPDQLPPVFQFPPTDFDPSCPRDPRQRRIDDFLADFQESYPSDSPMPLPPHAQEILRYTQALQTPLAQPADAPEQILQVCSAQFAVVREDLEEVLPQLSDARLKKDTGLLLIHLQGLSEAAQKHDQLFALATSDSERHQRDAWYFQSALRSADKTDTRARAIYRRAGNILVSFLSRTDYREARDSPETTTLVRLLQAARFLRKVTQAHRGALLSLSQTLIASPVRFERRLLGLFKTPRDKAFLVAGAASLGAGLLAPKLSEYTEVLKEMDREFTKRGQFLTRVSSQNNVLLDSLRKIRGAVGRLDLITKSIKGKIQNELLMN